MSTPLLTIEEVSRLLSVKVSTIYQWVHMEYIPHVKMGRLVRFDVDEVLKWIEARKQKGRHHRNLHF